VWVTCVINYSHIKFLHISFAFSFILFLFLSFTLFLLLMDQFGDTPLLISGPPPGSISVTASPPRTESGRLWAKGYLHPPSASSMVGFPDLDCTPSAILVVTSIRSFATPTASSDWNFYSVGLPSAESPLMTARTVSTSAIPDVNDGTAALVVNQTSAFWNTMCLNTQAMRTIAQSDTFYLNCSATTNQGQLYAVQMRPDKRYTTGVPAGTGLAYPAASAVLGQELLFDSTPWDYNFLAQLPGMVTWPARLGAFIPRRFHSSNLPYTDATLHTEKVTNVGNATNFDTQLAFYVPFNEFDVPSIAMIGLAATATVIVKTVVVVEVQAGPNSIYGPLARIVTPPDPDAITWGCENMFHQALVLPAANNDFGSFMENLITDGAGMLAGMIPGIGGIAAPLARGAVSQLFKGGARKPKAKQKQAKKIEQKVVRKVEKQLAPRTRGRVNKPKRNSNNRGHASAPSHLKNKAAEKALLARFRSMRV
jgi:hypothetical protein